MEAYLDNSATTKCRQEVIDLMVQSMQEDFGNPSSMHQKGLDAENYIKEARSRIAKTLKVKDKELYFTSGGTEGNNMAIIGGAMANKRTGNKVITTSIEHASVGNPFAYLEKQGFEVAYLPVDGYGVIDLEALKKEMTPETILVSIMMVNNEIGAVEPVEEAARIIHEANPNCLFHVDAIQAYGKMQILPARWGIDLLTVSGHKIHGPKGSGFIYIREKAKVLPQILGGGQELGMRSGTENVPAIAGLGLAAKLAYDDLDANGAHLYELRDALIVGLSQIDGVTINGKLDHENAPQIVSVSVRGVRAEVLLHALEDKGIYVSAGSACSSNKPAVSKTLKAIGLDKELLDQTVRMSLCYFSTMDEIDYTVETMSQLVPMLKKYSRR